MLNIERHASRDGLATVTDRATRAYALRGLKFTVLRRHVVEILAEKDTPVGAYDIRRVLSDRFRPVAPISVYRALGSLIEVGLVRKLATRNAFFLAGSALRTWHGDAQQRISLVCTICERVCEAGSSAAYDAIEAASASVLFSLSVSSVEVTGVCDRCSARRPAPARSVKTSVSRGRP